MKKRILAAALAAACLTGCGGPQPQQLPQESGREATVVAYVPLDDRPVNTDRVAYLARSLGYDLQMPEESLYHTCLDGQSKNPNGTAYGDRAGLYEWVLEQEAAGCDRYILSLDQLLSGGLVNSRSFAGGDVTLSDGTVLTETELIDGLLEALGGEENQVYLLDTVMRLAPTVGYDGWDLEGYEALRAYGMEERAALSGDALTVENIAAGYETGGNGQTLTPEDFGLTQAQVERYLLCRERKLMLTDHALQASEGMDNVHFLIGVDDSAPSASIQTNELAYLRQAVEGRGAVLSGADEDGMLAVCRMYALQGDETPQVRVRYFGGSESSASSDYDHQSMTEIVAQHLAYLGAEQTEEDADLELLVLTAPAEEGESESYIDALIQALRDNQSRGVPTILMDAAKNGYGTAFQTQLVKKTDLGGLLGYAGYYDLANVTGIALANGLGRWLCLNRGGPQTQSQQDDFIRTLADSLIKDICYKNATKPRVALYVKEDLRGDPDNFCASGVDLDTVLSQAEQWLEEDSRDVLKNLSRSAMLVDLEGNTAGLGTLTLLDLAFPWQRTFEIRLTLTIDSGT